MLLVLNSGSSTIKFEIFATPEIGSVASGIVERIGEAKGRLELRCGGAKMTEKSAAANHREALELVFEALREAGVLGGGIECLGVGHRIVHGGESFSEPVVVSKAVIDKIKKAAPLAPLHNPAAVEGIKAAGQVLPDVPQVAVFDTAFHQTMPPRAYRYALPAWCYRKHAIRRYGMHGTSHAYVARRAARQLRKPLEELKLITLHLGNGASVAAIDGGECVDTSMGLTPLEGLVMGTRSGDLDPAIPMFLIRETGRTAEDIDRLLNKESGLKGLCGENDVRGIVQKAEAGNEAAELALDIFCYRIRKYIGAYLAALGGADAVVFTAGIGENSAVVRSRTVRGLEQLGIVFDEDRNLEAGRREFSFHADESNVRLLVVATSEERAIAEATWELVGD
ncbi:acetate kinase [Stratiformator vulcanicus]|uniref:Acetate kinase n=1 Tax=Stratiformator vulcanicus TaxID=2527980 RepID=A0A517QZF6_9PLAN|nr:acetate kinase [Stratiformator vulcanicus]QDT36984.1 Acetate kinase [Stratiformator vulcanicus]